MVKKLDIEYVKNFCKEISYLLLDNEYISNSKPLNFIDQEGYKYYKSFINISNIKTRNNKGNEKWGSDCFYSIYNVELYLSKYKKYTRLLSKKYKSNKDNLLFYCILCENNFEACWNNMLNHKAENNCPYCCNQKVYIKNCLATIYPYLIEEWDYEKNYPLTPFDITAKSNRNVWWICKKCKRNWKTTPNARSDSLNSRYGIFGCGGCSSNSRGEEECKQILYKYYDKKYVQKQFRFSDCKDKNTLAFDFYLPINNICIEYQGIQHYEYLNRWGGEKQFIEMQKRDNIKKEYCKNKSIKLIEIPYWDFDNIEQILIKELNINL